MRGNIGLVVGRKGSGKTALFRQGEELFSKFGLGDVNLIRLNMDDLSWAAFADFKKLGLSKEHAATVSWQLALLLQLSARIVSEDSTRWSREARHDADVLRKFISDNFGEVTPSLAKSSKLIGQFGGLKVGAFGVTLETSFRESKERPIELVPSLTDAITQHLVAPLSEGAWAILLDKLDDSWDGSPDMKALLVGLLKAVKRINDDFGIENEPLRGVRAIAFLRSDINDALDFDEIDKHRSSTLEISWDHERLAEMMQNRLGETSLASIFESDTNQRKGRIPKGSFNYLVSRTFMRPRDLIQFLDRIQKAAPNAQIINREIVEVAERGYSRDKVSDLRNEYRLGAPWIEGVLSALRQGPNKYDSKSELESRIEEKIDFTRLPEDKQSADALIEWMIEISLLGAALRRTQTETIRFQCEGDPVSLEQDSTAWVHPALFAGLSLFEPRAVRQ